MPHAWCLGSGKSISYYLINNSYFLQNHTKHPPTVWPLKRFHFVCVYVNVTWNIFSFAQKPLREYIFRNDKVVKIPSSFRNRSLIYKNYTFHQIECNCFLTEIGSIFGNKIWMSCLSSVNFWIDFIYSHWPRQWKNTNQY